MNQSRNLLGIDLSAVSHREGRVSIGMAVACKRCFEWRRLPAGLDQRDIPVRPGTPPHGDLVEALRSLGTLVEIGGDARLRLHRVPARGRVALAAGERNGRAAP